MRRLAALCLLLPLAPALFALSFAFAAEAETPEVMAAVPGHPGLHYFDLLKLIVPDLAPAAAGAAVGHAPVPIKPVGGGKSVEPPADIKIAFLATRAIPGDPERLLLLADLGEADGDVMRMNALALVQLAPSPKLLDVVDVGADRETSFGDAPPIPLANKSPLIPVVSGHNNSNQAYLSTQLLFLRDDRLTEIGSFFTLSDHGCAFDRLQTPRFAPAPGGGLTVEVIETVKRTGVDCGDEDRTAPRAGRKSWRADYRWEAKGRRYVTPSKALERLFKVDEGRF